MQTSNKQIKKKKKPKQKKIKFKTLSIKVSEKQKNIIDKFCKVKKTSPNKFIKQAIKTYIVSSQFSVVEENYITENQLSLFDIEEFGE